MSQQNQNISVEQTARVCAIIAGSMISGVIFAGFFFVSSDVFQQAPDGQMMSYMMGGFAGICYLASLTIPNIITNAAVGPKSGSAEIDSGIDKVYASQYQTQLIIRLALLEGPAFANLVAFSQEKNTWTLGIVVWLVLVMMMNFPTTGRINDWIKKKKELAGFPQQDAEFN